MGDYSLDRVWQIWNDKHGNRIEVGPDLDSLGLVEIRYYTEDNRRGDSLTLSRDQASLVRDALTEMLLIPQGAQ
jgi:hypothetical protein